MSKKFCDAEAEVVGEAERRGLPGLGAAAEVPRLPRHDGRDARDAGGLARVGDRVHDLRGRGGEHQVDALGMDQVARHLSGDARRRLGVLVDHLHRVLRPADRKPLGEAPSSPGRERTGRARRTRHAGPVSGLTKPILIVWSSSETRGAAQICGAAAPATARPPAPTPARMSRSLPSRWVRPQTSVPPDFRHGESLPGGETRRRSYAGRVPRVKTAFDWRNDCHMMANPQTRRSPAQYRSRSSAGSRFSRRSEHEPLHRRQRARARGRASAAAARTATSRRWPRSATSQQDRSTRRYRLGPRVLDLGFSAINSMELREIAAPHLQELSDETGHTVNMAILDGVGHRLHRPLPQREPRASARSTSTSTSARGCRPTARRWARCCSPPLEPEELEARLDATELTQAGPEHAHAPGPACSRSSHRCSDRGARGEQRGARLRAAVDRRAGATRRTGGSRPRSTSPCTARSVSMEDLVRAARPGAHGTAREISARIGYRPGS